MGWVWLLVGSIAGCGGGQLGGDPAVPTGADADSQANVETLPETVISPLTGEELVAKFEAAQALLLADQFEESAREFDQIVRFDPNGPTASPSLYNAGLAYQALGDRQTAIERYSEQVRRFPAAETSRAAMLRTTRLLAYLEHWSELEKLARDVLRRKDLAVLDRIEAHGALGLSLISQGNLDDAKSEVMTARDLIDEHRLGEAGKPPLQLAQVSFALGEIRRVDSEAIDFEPMPDDFPAALEARCQGLLDAQHAYTEAMRSLDAHWSGMAGYRVGALYQQLHRDVMRIPPPPQATTIQQQQLFTGAMRLRYRILLEKGLAMMTATVEMGDRTGEASNWIARAEEAKHQLEQALDDEARAMEAMPYDEEELQAALDKLKKEPSP